MAEEEPAPEGSTRTPGEAHRPVLSGKVSALVLVVCFALTAALIPFVLRWPGWMEAEVVLAVWWLMWTAALTVFLYRGRRLSHDYEMRQPRSWLSLKDWNWGFDIPAANLDAEGCLIGLVILLALPVLVFLIWLLIEVAIPALAFVMYFVVRGMLAQAVHDRHHCQGSLGLSLLWGATYATVYTGPLALLVWFAHFMAVPGR